MASHTALLGIKERRSMAVLLRPRTWGLGQGANGATELAINVPTLALSLFVLRWCRVHHAELEPVSP